MARRRWHYRWPDVVAEALHLATWAAIFYGLWKLYCYARERGWLDRLKRRLGLI